MIACLVILQVTLALAAESTDARWKIYTLLGWHKSIGITVFTLTAIRLSWRMANPVPVYHGGLQPYEYTLA